MLEFDIGPGQYFLSTQVTDNGRTKEAFGQWTQKSRACPPIMKNPAEHPVQERFVDQDEVEILGLERFTVSEMTAMGWKWLPLMELDLDGSPTLRSLCALEQQCQILTHDLRLGSQRNNRVAGAGGLDRKVTKETRFGVVGFACAPPGWFEKVLRSDCIREWKNRIHAASNSTNETISSVGASC